MAALTFDEFGTTPGGVPVGANGLPRVEISGAEPKEEKANPKNVLTFDEFNPSRWGDKAIKTAKDIGKSALSGIDKGISGLAGLPADTALNVDSFVRKGKSWAQGRPIEDINEEEERNGIVSRKKVEDFLQPYTSKSLHENSGLAHTPETEAGKWVEAGTEFVPSVVLPAAAAGRVARAGEIIGMGVAPGVASEAAGRATEGSALEPWARGAAALVTGGAGAIASAPSTAGRAVSRATHGATPAQIDEAEQLFQSAQQQGMPLTRAEAVQHVTNGGTNLGNLQRVVEGSGELRPMMSQRPGQVDAAARREFDNLAPASPSPSAIGEDVSVAARGAVAETPQGRALSDSVYQAGPRVSPADAGSTIQSELARVGDKRESMRSALADHDYSAARNAPATIPVNGGHRVTDVTKHYLDRPDIPIILDPAERSAAQKNWFSENNPTSRTAIVGERPTEFAQVDASSVVAHIDSALESAKGAVRQGLTAARSALMNSEGAVDHTVQGLHNSRKAIDDLITQAKNAGAKNTVTELMGAKSVLDTALEKVPAYGDAVRNFKAASEPLSSFESGRAPGRIVERDQFNQRFEMTPDKVADTIQRGGRSAARDFNQVATPAAREAFEQHLITQTLEKARGQGGEISAESIRKAIRKNEDVIGEFPGVRDRLDAVARARDALEPVLATPIGKLAQRDPTTKKAINVLFPENPLPNSQREVGNAVRDVARRNRPAATALVRAHTEMVFNEATSRLQTGANEFAGAGFAAALRGNKQQAANLEAAITGLQGRQTFEGFDRFLDVLEAQGARQRIGSQTAFNQEVQQSLKQGGTVGEALSAVASGGVKLPAKITQRIEQWRMGGNVREIADILTNPQGADLFRRLATAPPDSALAARIVGRLTYLAGRSSQDGKGEK
jgi:hypothetical protein